MQHDFVNIVKTPGEEDKSFDDVETALIRMLEAGDVENVEEFVMRQDKLGYHCHAGNLVLNKEIMKPRDAYTIDLSALSNEEDSRVYTENADYLLRPTWEILGDSAEMIAMGPDGMGTWYGYRKRSKLPRGAMVIGSKCHAIYEVHMRTMRGQDSMYLKDVIAFNSKGRPMMVRYSGARVNNPGAEGAANGGANLCASIIEDAHRSGAFLASVFDHMTLRFPVAASAYKDFFSEREEPLTPTGRRKAIIHWVKQHTRKNSETPIERHTRGVKEISMNGVRVTVEAF